MDRLEKWLEQSQPPERAVDGSSSAASSFGPSHVSTDAVRRHCLPIPLYQLRSYADAERLFLASLPEARIIEVCSVRASLLGAEAWECFLKWLSRKGNSATTRVILADPASGWMRENLLTSIHPDTVIARLSAIDAVAPGLARIVEFPFYSSIYRVDDLVIEVRHLSEERSMDPCPAFCYLSDHPLFEVLTAQFNKMFLSQHATVWKPK